MKAFRNFFSRLFGKSKKDKEWEEAFNQKPATVEDELAKLNGQR